MKTCIEEVRVEVRGINIVSFMYILLTLQSASLATVSKNNDYGSPWGLRSPWAINNKNSNKMSNVVLLLLM